MTFSVPERERVIKGDFKTTEKDGNYGLFRLQNPYLPTTIIECFAVERDDWEFVSVRMKRCKRGLPSAIEINYVKNLFWDDDTNDVFQIMPVKLEDHERPPNSLKLYRSLRKKLPIPPADLL